MAELLLRIGGVDTVLRPAYVLVNETTAAGSGTTATSAWIYWGRHGASPSTFDR